MGKKGKKTRWRRLPIGGTDEESGLSLEAPAPPSDHNRHRVTFNEDEYTKITTPRQDVLFKKGYFGRKRTPTNPSPSETQEVHSGDSVENESYMGEEPQYVYPAPTGYMDPTTGVYYVNGNTFETYDPYTGTVTVVVGPPAQYPGGPPVLAALPCQPVPLQPVEWFNPAAAAPWCYSYNRRKRYSTDSQNYSAQSSESTGPPGSPQEPMDEAAAGMYPPPSLQYIYPGCDETGYLCQQNCSAQSSESTGPPGSPQELEQVDEAVAGMYPPPPLHYIYPGCDVTGCLCQQNCSAQSSESTGPPGSPQELEQVDEAAAGMYPPPPLHYIYPGCDVTGCLCQQNCSAQSSESTGPPGSPQEPVDETAAGMYPPPSGPHYVYPGYMFGPPIYNMNGMTMQGVMPQPVPMPPDLTANKRRKKRRRRRRGGVTDDGSESSCCEEPLTCDMTGCQSETSQSGASSDAGVGPNSDSGINTNSGSNSPPLDQQHQHMYNGAVMSPSAQAVEEYECATTIPDAEVEVSEELSTAEEDFTPNLCVAAPEFSSQESTLSCVSTPSAARDMLPNEQEVSNDVTREEVFESCHSISLMQEVTAKDEIESIIEASSSQGTEDEPLLQPSASLPDSPNDDLTERTEENVTDIEEGLCEVEFEKIPVVLMAQVPDENELPEVDLVMKTPDESLKTSTNSENEEESDSTSDQLLDLDEVIIAQETQTHSHATPDAQEKDLNSAIEEEKVIEEPITKQENLNGYVVSFIFQSEKEKVVSDEKLHKLEATPTEDNDRVEELIGEDVRNKEATEQICVMKAASTLEKAIPTCEDSLPRLPFGSNALAPVPPPRRKKSQSRAADRVATRVVEEAIKEGLEEAARVRLKNPLSITEAVTRWLNSHESSPLACPASDEESDNDEGIEVEEEESTGPKNVRGNPFLASSHSDAGQRVANDCESLSSAGEWDMWDHSHTREMCDPSRSVDRYYRLGADEGVPSVYKTAMHIRHTGPFPCGVCCIIQ